MRPTLWKSFGNSHKNPRLIGIIVCVFRTETHNQQVEMGSGLEEHVPHSSRLQRTILWPRH